MAFCFQPEIIPEGLRVHNTGRGWEIALNYRKSTIKTYKVYSMLLQGLMMGQMAGVLPALCSTEANNVDRERMAVVV